MIDNFEDFERYVQKYNSIPGGFGNKLSRELTSYQLQSRFNTYTKRETAKLEKSKNKISPFSSRDVDWINVKKEILLVDEGKCQLLESLEYLGKTDPDFRSIYLHAKSLYNPEGRYDPAHVLSRGSTPALKYDIENIVTLSRVFHSRIDYSRDPITGDIITKEDISDWWDLILEVRSLKFGKEINTDYLKRKAIKLKKGM